MVQNEKNHQGNPGKKRQDAWKEVKSQIVSRLCNSTTPEEINALVRKISSHIDMPTPHSKRSVRTPKKIWEQERFFPITEHCFHHAFTPILNIMLDRRPYDATDLRPFGSGIMSKLEDGLFVDFLLEAICVLQEWRSKETQKEYLPGDLPYPQILQATSNKHLLHGGLFVDRDNRGRMLPGGIIRASSADEIQIEYFYGRDYVPPFPSYRRSDASTKTQFNFQSVSHPFNLCSQPDELWRNFYIRELHWGTNLAALLSRYEKKVASADWDGICSQVWNHCTSETADSPNLVQQLMKIPSPAYRISFINGILRHALNPDEAFKYMDNGWLVVINRYDPKQQIITTNYKLQQESTHEISTKDRIPCCQFSALTLLIAVWNSMENKPYKAYTSLELEQYFNSFLGDSYAISRFIEFLCYSVRKALEDLFNLPVADDLSKVRKRWPLLLIPNHNDLHIQKLMKPRNNKTEPRDKYTRAFAELQRRTYHSYP